jgi:hypothetical protein
LASSSVADLWSEIAASAAGESPLWADSLRLEHERERVPAFSSLGEPRFAVGVETIYEGYLAHYGRPRLFAPPDYDAALLLGDYLYAQGLVRIAEVGDVRAVAHLAALISLCAQLRADGAAGDGAAWAASAALLGRDAGLEDALAALRDGRDSTPLLALARSAAGEDAVERALAAHARRLR